MELFYAKFATDVARWQASRLSLVLNGSLNMAETCVDVQLVIPSVGGVSRSSPSARNPGGCTAKANIVQRQMHCADPCFLVPCRHPRLAVWQLQTSPTRSSGIPPSLW